MLKCLANAEDHFYLKRGETDNRSRNSPSIAQGYRDKITEFCPPLPQGGFPKPMQGSHCAQRLEPWAGSQLGLYTCFCSFYYKTICLGSFHLQKGQTLSNHKSHCFSQCFNHQISFSLLGQDILIVSFSFFICELGMVIHLCSPHRIVVRPGKIKIAASYREIPHSRHCAQCSTWITVCRSLNYPTKQVLLQLRK